MNAACNDARESVPDDLVELGFISGAHGVKGAVRVQPHDSRSGVLGLAPWWWLVADAVEQGALPAGSGAGAARVRVRACHPHGNALVAMLDGIDDRTHAQALKGWRVCVPRSAFPPAGPEEYYWVDLVGCEVWGEHSGAPVRLGVVAEVLDNGAHCLLRVAAAPREAGAPATRRAADILVPFVAAHVSSVNLPARRIDTNWPAEF